MTKRSPDLAVLVLWIVAVVATLLVTVDAAPAPALVPIWVSCLVGSGVALARPGGGSGREG